MQEVWIPWRGLACAVTNVFCFFQLCGFWCELLDDDARQALLVNYILRLVLVFYLCMLNGQAVLGQFIVVSSENRQAEHTRWNCHVLHICTCEGPIGGRISPWVTGQQAVPAQHGGRGDSSSSLPAALEQGDKLSCGSLWASTGLQALFLLTSFFSLFIVC